MGRIEGKLLTLSLAVALCVLATCGGNVSHTSNGTSNDLCSCTPAEPASADFRHAAKHVPIPNGTPQEISVSDILSWPQGSNPGFDAPRTGRETQLFHIAKAFLQALGPNPGDCDIHFEISQVADKTAPRVIVETPIDSEFCPSRHTIQSQLAARNIMLPPGGDLPVPLTVEVLGLAFEDFEHSRGSPQVATQWELHPAIVTLTTP